MGLVNPVRSIVFESNIESNVDHDLSTLSNNKYQTSNGVKISSNLVMYLLI